MAFFLEVGLLLIVLPWSAFWERNYFASVWPLVRRVVVNNFVRGAISGLGVVNLVAGFAELVPMFVVRHRDETDAPAETPSYSPTPDTQVDP